MTGKLKKDGLEGAYSISSTLAGIDGPGRRIVRRLALRRLASDDVDLAALSTFVDLEHLEIHGPAAVDLSVLGMLPRLTSVSLQGCRSVDLQALARVPALESLILYDVASHPANGVAFSPTLRSLTIGVDDPSVPSTMLKDVVAALDWSAVPYLRSLMLVVGGVHDLPPVALDLTFLRHLTRLERLDFAMGIVDASPDPSPLRPPFDGLSKHLRHVRFEVDGDAAAVQRELATRMGVDPDGYDAPAISQRRAG